MVVVTESDWSCRVEEFCMADGQVYKRYDRQSVVVVILWLLYDEVNGELGYAHQVMEDWCQRVAVHSPCDYA